MFRPSLGHPQALKENRSKITYMFYRNALWDPKRSQNCCIIDCHICVFNICQNTSGWQTLKKIRGYVFRSDFSGRAGSLVWRPRVSIRSIVLPPLGAMSVHSFLWFRSTRPSAYRNSDISPVSPLLLSTVQLRID